MVVDIREHACLMRFIPVVGIVLKEWLLCELDEAQHTLLL